MGGDEDLVVPSNEPNADDDEFAAEIRRLAEQADPVPESVVEAARAAFRTRRAGDIKRENEAPADADDEADD